MRRPQPLTFEDLFADQHERLHRALYLIVGNSHEVEELLQDAFVKVLERWDRIDNRPGTCIDRPSIPPAAGSGGFSWPRNGA
jgi:DNA-directed RNA polymerase specialized sigma24 family protein